MDRIGVNLGLIYRALIRVFTRSNLLRDFHRSLAYLTAPTRVHELIRRLVEIIFGHRGEGHFEPPELGQSEVKIEVNHGFLAWLVQVLEPLERLRQLLADSSDVIR